MRNGAEPILTAGHRVQDDPFVGAPLPQTDVEVTDRSVHRHSALGMRSPVDYERSLAGKDAA
jgi:hypothetical protein